MPDQSKPHHIRRKGLISHRHDVGVGIVGAAAQNRSAFTRMTLGRARTCSQHRLARRLVDLDQRDGVAAGRVAAEVEGGDVDAGVAEHGAEPADQARPVAGW